MIDSTVQFYFPEHRVQAGELPSTLDEYWVWVERRGGIGEIGRYTWTLKTYLYLKQSGLPTRLVTEFPRSGLVVSHRDYLPLHLVPRADVFLVCIKPDRKEHPWAHHYIVQNARDRIFSSPLASRSSHVLHWPQAHLMGRRPERGLRCESVGYFGRTMNLADELKSPDWSETLASLGFIWSIVPSAQWNDYRDVDVAVGIRSLSDVPEASSDPLWDADSKPPSKLVNAWLAGVPAIVGPESAYRNVRKGPLDYVEVGSLQELKEALLELRRNGKLYQAIVENGRKRAREFSTEAVLAQWEGLIRETIVPAYGRWMNRSRLARQAVNIWRAVVYLGNPVNIAAIKPYYETNRPAEDQKAATP